MMDTWKWNLAFQCIVNIGVRGSDPRGSGSDSRGSETIRSRVVEADVVPVLATILDNYNQVLEKTRARQDELEGRNDCSRLGSSRKSSTKDTSRLGASSSSARSERRRPAPPPIEILREHDGALPRTDVASSRPAAAVPQLAIPPSAPSPDDHSTFIPHRHHHHHHHHHIRPQPRARGEEAIEFAPSNPTQLHGTAEPFARPRNPLLSRDGLGMPPMTPGDHGEQLSSRPDTPTTPTPSILLRTMPPTRRRSASAPYPIHSSVLQQDLTMSGDSDEGEITGSLADVAEAGPSRMEPVQNDLIMEDVMERAVLLDTVQALDLPDPDVTGDVDAGTFNITHRSMDGSLIEPVAVQGNPTMDLSPIAPPFGVPEPLQLPSQPAFHQSFSPDRTGPTGLSSSVPRDEDVIMSLQLLAYVSKYPSLRPYFQQTHLVPKLKLGRMILTFDGDESSWTETDVATSNDEEYCQPDDYNIFPLVEKFTVRHHHAQDVNYWAGVVMRNLCRKDKARGDIRQCAYYKCGKWEEYARQFAKCRRCRQTKYCSKDCQKSAWVYHRHWCEPAEGDKRRGHVCPSGDHA